MIAMACAAVTSPAVASADPRFTGRVVVGLDPAAFGAAHAIATAASARVSGPSIRSLAAVTLHPRAGVAPSAVIELLRADGRVRYAEAEARFELRRSADPLLQAAPRSGAESGLAQWNLRRSEVSASWALSRGAAGRVAVIDTGVDESHPDLERKIDALIDLHPDAQGTRDLDGHGTHVASQACAEVGNGLGMAGTGRDCRLIVIRSDLSDASISQGIVAAADAGAHALNMSFGDDGSTPSRLMADALTYAAQRQVVLVAAAAGEPTEEQGEPANLLQPTGTGDDLRSNRGLVVTAAGATDRRASWAGRGSQISLGAYAMGRAGGLVGAYPGGPTALERGGAQRVSIDGDDRWASMTGTSVAAPQVAAVAATMRALAPELHASEVVRMIKASAQRPPRRGWGAGLGWGILDAEAAIARARDAAG